MSTAHPQPMMLKNLTAGVVVRSVSEDAKSRRLPGLTDRIGSTGEDA